MPHAYTEDQLVEPPAKAEPPSPQPSPSGRGSTAISLGRETKGKVVWVSQLSRPFAGLERLNPAMPPEAITAGVDELTRDRSSVCRSSRRVKAN